MAGRLVLPLLALALPLAASAQDPAPAPEPGPARHRFEGVAGAYIAERVLEGLSQPAAIQFLPDGHALIAQRNTAILSRVDFASGTREDLSGLPEMLAVNDTGLHDIEPHPDYAQNGWIYISYSIGRPEYNTVALDRIRLDGARVVEHQRVFTANAYSESPYHCGGRIQFLDGYLYMTVGDRQHPETAQDRTNHAGTIVRLFDDGRVPEDNPFVGAAADPGAKGPPLPEIWSWGHRNPQGLVVDTTTGVLWENEHGPRGGDEINRIVRGANYGWPVISYGFEYEGGPIGKGIVQEEGMQQPVWVYVPSIAPSDLVIYRGAAFPSWQGSLLTTALALTQLNRLALAEDGAVVIEERLARNVLGRLRSVAVDRDGLIYVGNDLGEIWRLRPE